MENTVKGLTKVVYLFDKSNDTLTIINATISIPIPVGSVDGDHYCNVEIDKLLTPPKKIYGVDPFQAVYLSIQLIENLLTHTASTYEVQNKDETKYVSFHEGAK